MGDIFALEDDVAQNVSALLRQQLGAEVHLRRINAGTSNPEARALLLKAERDRADARAIGVRMNPQDAGTAITLLEQADSLLAAASQADPQWIEPGLARGWVMLDLSRLSTGDRGRLSLRSALSRANAVLSREPRSAGALELEGTVLFLIGIDSAGGARRDDDMQHAEAALRQSVAIDSTRASAWSELSQFLRVRGDFAGSEWAAEHAIAADAFLEDAANIFDRLTRTNILLGNNPKAAEWCDRGRRAFPADWRFVECQLSLLLHDTISAPNPRRAWALVARLDSMDPPAQAATTSHAYSPIYHRMVAAAISARAGDRDSALAVMARARRTVDQEPEWRTDLLYDEAYVRIALGQPDSAIGLLRRYLTARPTLTSYIRRDPLFTSLRGSSISESSDTTDHK
jgi:tetratricopeptide (TPR) repeat protein